MDVNIYSLRPAILRDFKRFLGAPVAAEELAEISLEPAIIRAGKDTVAAECRELAGMGFLTPVAGFGGKYLQITEKGLKELAVEFDHSPFIYGPGAAK